MTGRPRDYRDAKRDITSFIHNLATVPGRHDTHTSSEGTKAEAFKFRQRLYGWRRSVLATLANPETKEAKECAQWLGNQSKRITKDWLDYTKFHVREQANGMFVVVGEVGRPMDGPDIRFNDQMPDLTETIELIKQAQRDQFRRFNEIPARPADDDEGTQRPLTPSDEGAQRPAPTTDGNVTTLPGADTPVVRLIGGVDVDAIAFDLRCDPTPLRELAQKMAADRLLPQTIEGELRRRFA